MFEGYGESFSDNVYYFGNFKNQKKEGFGIAFWLRTGDIYVGYWQNGRQNGFGCIKSRDREDRYGMWSEGTCSDWITYESTVRALGKNAKIIKVSRKFVEQLVSESEEELSRLLEI